MIIFVWKSAAPNQICGVLQLKLIVKLTNWNDLVDKIPPIMLFSMILAHMMPVKPGHERIWAL